MEACASTLLTELTYQQRMPAIAELAAYRGTIVIDVAFIIVAQERAFVAFKVHVREYHLRRFGDIPRQRHIHTPYHGRHNLVGEFFKHSYRQTDITAALCLTS